MEVDLETPSGGVRDALDFSLPAGDSTSCKEFRFAAMARTWTPKARKLIASWRFGAIRLRAFQVQVAMELPTSCNCARKQYPLLGPYTMIFGILVLGPRGNTRA